MKTEYGYKCSTCPKEYKEKFNYDRHVVCCEFLCKSRREQINEIETGETIPTPLEMYRLIQELAIRNEKLEKELSKLKHMQKKKINILEWLNSEEQKQNNPTMSFIEWINKDVIIKIQEVLSVVYSDDLLTGINQLFHKALEPTTNYLPIRAFENKPGIFYIFKKGEMSNGEWQQITNTDFDKILSQISHQFIVEFKKHWYIPNQERVENDEHYKDMYINYYQRILGGNERISEEVRFLRIRQTIFHKIRQNIKSIIEYDFK
jgi:hypothetical protein